LSPEFRRRLWRGGSPDWITYSPRLYLKLCDFSRYGPGTTGPAAARKGKTFLGACRGPLIPALWVRRRRHTGSEDIQRSITRLMLIPDQIWRSSTGWFTWRCSAGGLHLRRRGGTGLGLKRRANLVFASAVRFLETCFRSISTSKGRAATFEALIEMVRHPLRDLGGGANGRPASRAIGRGHGAGLRAS